jgi:hypothetical protein
MTTLSIQVSNGGKFSSLNMDELESVGTFGIVLKGVQNKKEEKKEHPQIPTYSPNTFIHFDINTLHATVSRSIPRTAQNICT